MSDEQKSPETKEKRTESAAGKPGQDNVIRLPEDPALLLLRKRRRRGIWILSGAVLVTVLVLLFVLLPDVFDFDAIRRYFRYMGKTNREDYGTISFDNAGNSDYAPLGDGLALGTEGGLYFYDMNGRQQSMVQATVAAPRLLANEDTALLYAMGSSYLTVINDSGEKRLEQTLGGVLLDVDLSADGYVCYNQTQDGYKTVTTVLGQKLEPIYRFRSSTQYLNACAISGSGAYLAVAGLTEEDSSFTSTLTILKTDEEIVAGTDQSQSAKRRMNLGNQVVYELAFLAPNRLCVIAQDALLIVDTACNVVAEYPFEAAYLRGYAISDRGFAVLLLGRSMTGEHYTLCTIDKNGEQLGQIELNRTVRSLDARGGYVAVLSDTTLELFRSRLQSYAVTENIGTATKALVRSDGSAMLISNGLARLYLP